MHPRLQTASALSHPHPDPSAPDNQISILICLPGDNDQPGGAHQITQDIARGVAHLGARVYLAFIANNRIIIENVATGAAATIVIHVRGTLPALLYLILRSLRIDVIHGHLGTFLATAWIAWCARIPSVRTIHGRLDRPGMRTRRERILSLIAIRLLHQNIIAVADTVAADMQATYQMQPNQNLFAIPNGYTLKVAQQPTFPILPPLTFIFVGRFEAAKGFAELLAAFLDVYQQGAPIRLHLIGDGVARAQLDPDLLATGAISVSAHWLTRQEVTMALGQAHVFVLPSHSEGLSLALLEAMALGVVPIVSHAANAYGIVRHGINGYTFATGSKSALIGIINHIVTYPDRLGAMRQAAHETVKQQFTLQHTCQAHLDLYHQLRYHNKLSDILC